MNDTELSNSSSSYPRPSDMTEVDLVYWQSILSDSRYTVQRILVPIVLIIGAFGNSITIAVMTRRHMQSSTNLYLTALAISDLMYLVFMFSLSLKHSPGMSHHDYLMYWHYYRYALWLIDASSSTSIWLTVTFTVERYIAVCHPMKGKVLCTQSRAKRVILSVYILCFFLTSTTPHEWKVVPNPNKNETHVMLDYSDLGRDEIYKKAFYWFSAVIFILLPLVLLATFNLFLVLAVKRSRKKRWEMNVRKEGQSMQENKITIMLIAVVLLALLCQMPTAVMLMYTSFHQLQPETVEFYVCIIMNNFFNLLTGVNAAVNFIFYCALSNRYRKTFLQTFCSKWYAKHHPSNSWIATTGYTNVDDGSPRTSFKSSYRGSSVRTSRRSSFRSSLSSTPRASPSHSSHKGAERRNTTGSFLKVPPRSHGSLSLPDDTTANISLCESPEPTQMPSQNGRPAKNLELRLEEHEMDNLHPSPKTSNAATGINSDDEGTPDILSEPTKMKRTFNFGRFLRTFRQQPLFHRGPPLAKGGQNILIKYQQPSAEDQEQTNV